MNDKDRKAPEHSDFQETRGAISGAGVVAPGVGSSERDPKDLDVPELNIRGVLGISLTTFRRNWTLLIPLLLAELGGVLLGLIPAAVVALAFYRNLEAFSKDPFLLWRMLRDPGLWATYGVGFLLALAGGWLLRTLARAGTIGTLAADLAGQSLRPQTSDSEAPEPFLSTLLDRPERWLVAGAAASLLRLFGALCGLGSVAASMLWFTQEPGVGPALGMTVSTGMLLCVPILDAALGLGFAHSVVGDKGGFTALGEGTLHAARRARVVGPLWYLFVLLAILAALIPTGGASLFVGNAAPGALGAVLRASLDVGGWVVGAAIASAVVLWRLGAWTVLAAEELKRPSPATAYDLRELVVLDAVALGEAER